MHLTLSQHKSQVSETDFDKIHKASKLPLTTVKIVRSLTIGSAGPSNVAPVYPTPAGSQGLSVDQQIIRDNLPRPDYFINKPPASGLLGALVYYVMILHLVPNRKLHTGQEKLGKKFNVTKSGLKRVITGTVRKGGKQYKKDREREAEHLAKEAKAKDKAKREKVKEAAAAKLAGKASDVKIGFACHICGEQLDSHPELDDHLNDHQKKTTYYTCPHCKEKFTDFMVCCKHEKSHDKNEFICCECRLNCKNYKNLVVHSKIHKFPCQMCLQVLNSRDELRNHMKFLHGRPIPIYKCSICTFAAAHLTQYHAHFNRMHRRFEC